MFNLLLEKSFIEENFVLTKIKRKKLQSRIGLKARMDVLRFIANFNQSRITILIGLKRL